MRTYWIETLLIAALFTTAMGFTLAQAESATPEHVYGDKTGVVPDYVYGNTGGNNETNIASRRAARRSASRNNFPPTHV